MMILLKVYIKMANATCAPCYLLIAAASTALSLSVIEAEVGQCLMEDHLGLLVLRGGTCLLMLRLS